MSNVYNLQTKISKEVELKYKILSEKDRRKISNLTKLILEMLVEDMIIEDESTHRLHIEKLALYNKMFYKTTCDIEQVIVAAEQKKENRKVVNEEVSNNKETLENQSTTQTEKANIVKNRMFASK